MLPGAGSESAGGPALRVGDEVLGWPVVRPPCHDGAQALVAGADRVAAAHLCHGSPQRTGVTVAQPIRGSSSSPEPAPAVWPRPDLSTPCAHCPSLRLPPTRQASAHLCDLHRLSWPPGMRPPTLFLEESRLESVSKAFRGPAGRTEVSLPCGPVAAHAHLGRVTCGKAGSLTVSPARLRLQAGALSP